MAASFAIAGLKESRRWRGVIAVLVSLTLIASLFHCCCCFEGDEVTLTDTVVQTASNEPGKTAPCSGAVHCCHCLAHVTTVAAQTDITSIEYVTRIDRVAALPAPDAADLDSLFKPPRT